MFKSYLLLTLRNISRNKIPFVINLVGMSIGLGLCIAAYVNYEFNADFDRQQTKADNIYRVSFIQQHDGQSTPYGVSPMPLGNLIRENVQDVDEVIYYISKGSQFRIGQEMFEKEFVYTDPAFLKSFVLEKLYGTISVDDKANVLISDKLAKTYFGTDNVIGQPLVQIINGLPREFIISGVYKAFPSNSTFRFDLITNYQNYFNDPAQRTTVESDWKKWSTVFLKIDDASAIARVEAYMQKFIGEQNEARPDLKASKFYIEPFKGMSYRAGRQRNQGHWFNQPMPPAAVIAPFAMAGFLLLVACFNFTNNAIAQAGRRLKEIGIRKVIGGRRKELIIQFLSETLIFCALALVIALFLAEVFIAGWDLMWGGLEFSIRYKDNIPFLAVIACLLVVAALIAGGYPAFYISRFKPIEVLRGTTRFGGTNLFTKTLLVLQFSIALAATIFAIAFYFNSRYQREYDLGYNYREVIQVPVENEAQFVQLRDALEKNPQVKSIAGSQHHIFSSSAKASATDEKAKTKEVDVLNVGDNYFKTLNVRMNQGREFIPDAASDINESIIVNEQFLKEFGLKENAIGTRIMLNDTARYFIVGVVQDVYLQALFQPLSSVVFKVAAKKDYKYLVASASKENLETVHADVKAAWQKTFPNTLYPGRLMEQRMVMTLEHFDGVVKLYTFLGIVAIILSVSGLYSLVSLNLQRRTKELGIRKILGAPLHNIVMHASRLFLVILAISFVIGSFAGAFMVNKLMDSVWEYYVAIDQTIILSSIGILFAIAATTVLWKILRVSAANPTEALKYE